MDTLLAEAAELIAATTNLNVTYTYDQEKIDRGIDGHLTITNRQQKYTWGVELKNRLTRQILAKLTTGKTMLQDEKALIIVPYSRVWGMDADRAKVQRMQRSADAVVLVQRHYTKPFNLAGKPCCLMCIDGEMFGVVLCKLPELNQNGTSGC